MDTYQAAVNDGSDFARLSSGYRLQEADGTILRFDADGKLSYAEDGSGNRIYCHYNDAGVLDRLTSASGDSVEFTRDPATGLITAAKGSGVDIRYSYDENGNLTKVVNGDQVTDYGYFAENVHSLTQVQENGSRTATFTYDALDRLVSRQTTAGDLTVEYRLDETCLTDTATQQKLRLVYNVDGQLIRSEIEPSGKTVSYRYGTDGALLSCVDDAGEEVSSEIVFGAVKIDVAELKIRDFDFELSYPVQEKQQNYYTVDGLLCYRTDGDGRPIGKDDVVNEYTTVTCTADGELVSYETMKDGVRTVYARQSTGEISVTVEDQKNYVEINGIRYTTFDASGNPLPYGTTQGDVYVNGVDAASGDLVYYAETHDGETVICRYDAAGNLTSRKDASGTAIYRYDSSNRLISICDQNDETQTFAYYDDGTLHTIKGTDGCVMEYDIHGNLFRQKDSSGHSVYYQNTYDGSGNLIGVVDPNGTVTTYTYDADNVKTSKSVTSGDGTTTELYDVNGNVTACTLPDGGSWKMEYDDAGNVTLFTDQLGNTTRYAYTDSGTIASITYADGSMDQYTYTENGSPYQWTNRAGEIITYSYDGGVLSSVAGSDGRSVSYTYDADGNLTGIGDVTYTCDSETNTSVIRDGEGRTIQFRQDENGHNLSVTTDGMSTACTYTVDGQLDTVCTSDGALLLDYDYNPAGNISVIRKGNGTSSVYTYAEDNGSRLTAILEYAADGTLSSETRYGYDDCGRVISRTENGGTWNYTYDLNSRLLTEALTDADGNCTDERAYTYDVAGNRLSSTVDGVTSTYTYNQLNQIVAETSGGVTTEYRYDVKGNLLEDGERIYTWSADNRLLSETLKSTGEKWSYDYNALGYRDQVIYSSADGDESVREYLIDSSGNVLAEYENDVLVKNYFYGGNLAGWTDAKGNVYYFNQDLLGTVTGVTDADGANVNTYRYDAWGNLLDDSTITVDNDFTYGGTLGLMQNDSGTYYVQARNYDAETGRWISSDPAGLEGGTNLYCYTLNSPLNGVDPSGLWTVAVTAGISAYMAILAGTSLSLEYGVATDGYGNFGTVTTITLGAGVGIGAGISVGATVAHTLDNSIYDLEQDSYGFNLFADFGVGSLSITNSGWQVGIGDYFSFGLSWPFATASENIGVSTGISGGGGLFGTRTSTLVSRIAKIGKGKLQYNALGIALLQPELYNSVQLTVNSIQNQVAIETSRGLQQQVARILSRVDTVYNSILPTSELNYTVGEKVSTMSGDSRYVTLNASSSYDTKGKKIGVKKYVWFQKNQNGSWERLYYDASAAVISVTQLINTE